MKKKPTSRKKHKALRKASNVNYFKYGRLCIPFKTMQEMQRIQEYFKSLEDRNGTENK